MARNLAASARQRLLNLSKTSGTDYNQLLIRYGIERLLYRLGGSGHADEFILKGAMLFALWEGSPHRPTQDVDLLGFGDRSLDRVSSVFRDLCALAVEDDGWTFDPATVEAEDIRTVDEYGGVRIHLTVMLGSARIRVQVDIGFGDAVTPPASIAAYPSLFGFPSPQLRVYPRETVVAEKVEAIVKLGLLNSRFKDYFDLRHLADHFEFDGDSPRADDGPGGGLAKETERTPLTGRGLQAALKRRSGTPTESATSVTFQCQDTEEGKGWTHEALAAMKDAGLVEGGNGFPPEVE